MARVRHPNVLAVHGADVFEGRIGLWSDLVVGRTLEQEIAEDGPLSHERWLEVALALASALDAVHRAGVIHGDVKTANVMTDADGRVLLMDFGAARPGTESTARVGSPLFMAPELFCGASLGRECDLYALGVVLYRAASGEYPVRAETFDELALHHREGAGSARLSSSRGGSIVRLVASLLTTEPTTRPSTEVVLDRLRWIASAPARRSRRIAVASVVTTLALGSLLSSLGFVASRRSERRAIAALSETEAVNDFLRDILVSPRPTESGGQTLVVELLERAVPKLDKHLAGLPLARARALAIVGETRLSMDDLEGAAAALGEALPVLEAHLGRDHEEALRASVRQAQVLSHSRRLDEAAPRFLRLIARCDRALGAAHEVTLAAILEAGNNSLHLQDFVAAESSAHEISRRIAEAGNDEREEGWLAQLLLARVYQATGRFGAAQEAIRPALDWAIETYGERHGNTLAARWNLALSLETQGELVEAETQYRHVYDTAREWLGMEQVYALPALSGLANLARQQGRLQEALELQQRAVEVNRRLRGGEDVWTLIAIGNQANVLKDLGRMAESESLYREVIAALERTEGVDSHYTLMSRTNLAEILLESGRPGPALEEAQAAYERLLQVFDERHIVTLAAASVRAAALVAVGRVAEGTTLLDDIVARHRELVGNRHSETLRAQVRLGLALNAAGRRTEAAALLRETVGGSRDALGPSHPLTRQAEAAWRALVPDPERPVR
jgi:tetratricopeptide (TPR) repeat protein